MFLIGGAFPETVRDTESLGTESAFEIGRRIDSLAQLGEVWTQENSPALPLIVIKAKINMREAPTTHTRVVTTVTLGTKLSTLGKKGRWYHVSNGVQKGYIREDMLALEGKLTEAQQELIQSMRAKQSAAAEALKQKARNEEKKMAAKQKAEAEARRLQDDKKRQLAEEKKLAAKLKADQERIAREKTEADKREQELAAREQASAKKMESERLKAEQLRTIREQKRAEDEKIKKLLALKEAREEERKRQAEIIRVQQENQMKLLLEKKKEEEELERKKELLKKEKIVYSSFGRRDPFIPVQQADLDEKELNIDQMKLVGIIWDQEDPLAVLEHQNESGLSVTLREGDKIANGKVAYINYEKITFEILEFGVYRTYTLKLVQ